MLSMHGWHAALLIACDMTMRVGESECGCEVQFWAGRSQARDDVRGGEDERCGEVGPDARHNLIVDPNDGLVLRELPAGAKSVMDAISNTDCATYLNE